MKKSIIAIVGIAVLGLSSCGDKEKKSNTPGDFTPSITDVTESPSTNPERPTESTTPGVTPPVSTTPGSTTTPGTTTPGTTTPGEETPREPDIFISEYIEGWYNKDYNPTGKDNDKAIELFNPLDHDVNLSGYSIVVYEKSSSTAKYTLNLEGTIKPKETFVVVNHYSQASLKEYADFEGELYFSGKQAVSLNKNNEVIDLIGEIGFEYQQYIGYTINGNLDALQNNRLIRVKGYGNNPVFNEKEWTVMGDCEFDDLGKYSLILTPYEEVVKYLKDKYDGKTFDTDITFEENYNGFELLFESFDEKIITSEGKVTLTGEKTECWIQADIEVDGELKYEIFKIYVM